MCVSLSFLSRKQIMDASHEIAEFEMVWRKLKMCGIINIKKAIDTLQSAVH